jgi:hypothetical protein
MSFILSGYSPVFQTTAIDEVDLSWAAAELLGRDSWWRVLEVDHRVHEKKWDIRLGISGNIIGIFRRYSVEDEIWECLKFGMICISVFRRKHSVFSRAILWERIVFLPLVKPLDFRRSGSPVEVATPQIIWFRWQLGSGQVVKGWGCKML